MKITKRIVSILLSLTLALGAFAAPGISAYAADGADTRLRFDKNGDFRILHLTDWHCDYPLPAVHKQLVLESIDEAKPDLVVLGGDLSEAPHEDQPAAIKEICDIFVKAEIPFVITFGNHDYMHDYTIDEMFAFYKEYGGRYFIGSDENPELFGCGTCSLPVYSNGGGKIAYNIYCFDSGDRAVTDGVDKGYDSVHADQIEWYKAKSEELRNGNGGKYVPSVVFQHIIVQEIYDKLFPVAKSCNAGVREYETVTYDLVPVPDYSNVKEGYIFEKPCPGYYNHGQLDAMSKNGDVRAIFCGHDHYNSFTVEIDDVDIINTPSIKPHILLRKINWGPRAITLHEDGTYENRVITACELAQKEGSKLISAGAVSDAEIFIVKIWKALVDTSLPFWSRITGLIYNL